MDIPVGNTSDKYDAKNPLVRRLVERFLRTFDAALPSSQASLVLEIGAGEGEIATRVRGRWPGARVVPLDLHAPEIDHEWRSRGLLGAFGDAHRLPFPDNVFDLVLAIEVLEHVPDPETSLGEIARVARADVVLSVPREPWFRAGNLARGKYVSAWGNTPGHLQHWSSRSFAHLVGRYFDVVSVRRPFPWTLVRARALRPDHRVDARDKSSGLLTPGSAG